MKLLYIYIGDRYTVWMESTLCILGRQPALGLAELESLFGAAAVTALANGLALVTSDVDTKTFNRLGGTIKTAHLIGELETTNWSAVESFAKKNLPKLLKLPNSGKLQLGISAYGLAASPAKIQALGLTLKKILRTNERTIRLIPNKETALSTAQVMHNHLTGRGGCEIILYAVDGKTLVAQTTNEQNINSYTLRDRERPKRDARVGMLPPKLAQIIVNLATGPSINSKTIVLDPFCGTGVVLQEALLMGCSAYGTDLEPRMINYTQANLAWLDQTFHTEVVNTHLGVGDATSYKWDHPFTAVGCESYLGQPLTSLPSSDKLQIIVHGCNLIISKFLRNIREQCPAGTRFCVAVPAWQTSPGRFKTLPLVDQIENLGYNRLRFEHAGADDFLYYRENQIVARQLLVLSTT
jgi:tRNA G10  N-methylase Trm11